MRKAAVRTGRAIAGLMSSAWHQDKKWIVSLLLIVAIGSGLLGLHARTAHAAADVLILDTTVTSGASSLEAQAAEALGLSVHVVDATTWAAMSTPDFSGYQAIVLGDPSCQDSPDPSLAPAEANVSTWGPAITGNVVVIGTDPVEHAPMQPGALTLISDGIAFAASQSGATGAYIDLSCYYATYALAPPNTPVLVLNAVSTPGSFTVTAPRGCPNAAHIVSTTPALAGLTDAALANWGCSTHDAFDTWPADFSVAAISRDIYSTYVAPDGTSGAPYILTRGPESSSIVPNPPQNVHATATVDNSVTVRWQPPVDNGSPITHYKVISLNSIEYAPGTVVATVEGDALSYEVTGLHDCQETEWEVEAVNAQSNVSSPAFAAENFPYGVWPHGAPHSPPSIVVILAGGLGSSNTGGTYAPLGDVPTYCSYTGAARLQPNHFPAPLADILSYFQGDPVSSFGYRTRLADALAGNDAVIVPFSYNGARFTAKQSNPANPQFVVAPYSASDPGNTDPHGAAAWMSVEVISIHKTWPNAAIYIIGHSNGGLVAEDWWLDTGQFTPYGVRRVWALDSPLNGVAKVGVVCTVLYCPAPLGRAVTQTYTNLWKNQATHDPVDLAADLNGMFIPVGTAGDPVYDLADTGSADGLISQVYFNEPTCATSGFKFPPCQPQGTSEISPCTPPSNLSFTQKHGVVMNCQDLIKQIAGIVSESD